MVIFRKSFLEGGTAVSLIKPVGSLRVDESDPDSGPYLFLELDRSGADAIYKQRYVRLRVELKNYISHK